MSHKAEKFWRVEKSNEVSKQLLVFVKVHLVEVKNGWRVERKKDLARFDFQKVVTPEMVSGSGWRRTKSEARQSFMELMRAQKAQKWIELNAFDEYLMVALELEDYDED